MRLLFDYQAFEMQKFGGVSRSYSELIVRLRDEKKYACKVGVKESDNVHLKEYELVSGSKPMFYTHDRWFRSKKWFKGQRKLTRKMMETMGYHNEGLTLNRDYCIHLLKRRQFDIFEPTFFDPYFLPYLKNKPFVLTVHDMIPEIMHLDEHQADQKKLLCPLATHIHVPSQNTKDDLIQILNIPAEKITVIPHGAPSTPVRRKSLFDFPYLLYVGARWTYKKFAPFISECAYVISKHPDLYVVCTGDDFSEEEERLFSKLKIRNHLISMHHVAEAELQALYQHAIAFVYPSAYEGFGMPILEAFVNGCPVLLNNTSCFPEVGGNAAIFFDINQEGNLAEHIELLIHCSNEERQQIIARGKKRANCFSWQESAKKLKMVYETIYNHC